MTQLQLTDLEKKARELSEREQVLNARENLIERESALNKRQKVFDEVDVKLDVLKKQIKAKEDILQNRTLELEKSSLESNARLIELKTREETVKKTIEIQQSILDKKKSQEIGIDASIKSKKAEILDLQAQIKEVKQYKDEQSRIAEDTIAQWNSTLVEFRKEADNIQLEKNKLSADVIRLEQDKSALIVETKKEEEKLEALDTSYAQKVEQYKSNLKALDIEIENKQKDSDVLSNSLVMRETELTTREKSLKLKEMNVNKREHELDQKERRLKMNYGIAGIDYENAV